MFTFTLTAALLQSAACLAQPAAPPSSPTRVLYQFPPSSPPTWIESMIQRPNNDLLITRAHVPELWAINTKNGNAALVKAFPIDPSAGETSLSGITNYDTDQYAVNYVPSLPQPSVGSIAGKQGIYTIDMRNHRRSTRYLPISEATWLNGMVSVTRDADGDGHYKRVENDALSGGPPHHRYNRVLLSGDCRLGGIFTVDPYTGQHKFFAIDATMKPALPIPGIGINGMRVGGDQIYYTSNGNLYRFRFSLRDLFGDLTLRNIGPVVKIATVAPNNALVDDIAMDEAGNVYVAAISQNTVLKVTPGGAVTPIAGGLNDTAILGPTECIFDQKNPRKLYVSTNRGQIAPVNGNFVEPGKVVVLQV